MTNLSELGSAPLRRALDLSETTNIDAGCDYRDFVRQVRTHQKRENASTKAKIEPSKVRPKMGNCPA